MKLIRTAENLVFPAGTYCICCSKYIDHTRSYSLCDHCIRHMKFGIEAITGPVDYRGEVAISHEAQPFAGALSAMGYGLYERRLIFSLKYDGKTYVAPILADILRDCLLAMLEKEGKCPWLEADIIVPVPIHGERLRQRGFNQAEKMAKHLGRKIGIRVMGDGLLRTKKTQTQRGLSMKEREENISQAFQVNPKRAKSLAGKDILLLDDIYTTGATARACAKALGEAGAGKVYFLSLLWAGDKDHGGSEETDREDRDETDMKREEFLHLKFPI